MHVLGDDAIKDPTKIEAEVRKQVEERRLRHERENEERKLTPEERKEKAFRKKDEDSAAGLRCLVFRYVSTTIASLFMFCVNMYFG